jgi:tRNA pseudouridine32 synthase/23S rRNA pseudouridine746 synthase
MYKIISDQRDFLIVSKSPGVSFHKEGHTEGLHEKIRADLGINTLYSVHRLDRITSGLLIFSKTEGIARELSSKFRNRTVEKYYIAISDRRPRKKQGTIKGDMEKSRRSSWKLTRENKDPAITSFFSYTLGEGRRLYLLRPYTGKTHQIRVAMKSIGVPVLGDRIYHKHEEDKKYDRGYLHSYALRFTLHGTVYEFEHKPESGELFLNETFLLHIKKCEHPWELNWPVIT